MRSSRKRYKTKVNLMIFFFCFLLLSLIILCVLIFTNTIDFSQKQVQTIEPAPTPVVATPVQIPEITTEPEVVSDVRDISIVFTGDICLEYAAPHNYESSGILGVLSEDMLAELTSADILMINNEFPFTTSEDKWPDKKFNFKVDPKYVSVLTDMGVDIATLANNHALDYGRSGLTDSITTLESAGIKSSGAGNSLAEASALKTFEVEGKTFGFLSASRVIPSGAWNITDCQPGLFCTYDEKLLVNAITEARSQVDYLFVYVHWGIERVEYPENYERDLATKYIQAGADAVIGTHPHVLQGIEFINGKPVFYSLGNFISSSTINKTMAIKITVKPDGSTVYSLIPAAATNYYTYKLNGDDAINVLSYVNQISFNATAMIDGTVLEGTIDQFTNTTSVDQSSQ